MGHMMLRFLMIVGLLGVTVVALANCATAPAVPPTTQTVPFLLERDLAGRTVGEGSFTAINGTRRDFTAYLDGSWDGQTLTLVEDFVYDDGEEDRKTWILTRQPDGSFTGTREDVVGEARGFYEDGSFRLEYDVILPDEDGDGGMKVRFRDVLVKRADGVVLNTATVGYYGLRVGRVELEIRRADEDQPEN